MCELKAATAQIALGGGGGYFGRIVTLNPLKCTPPNSAQSFSGPPYCSAPLPPLGCAYTLGDADADGVTNVLDMVTMTDFILNMTKLPEGAFCAADVDKNDVVDIMASAAPAFFIKKKIYV